MNQSQTLTQLAFRLLALFLLLSGTVAAQGFYKLYGPVQNNLKGVEVLRNGQFVTSGLGEISNPASFHSQTIRTNDRGEIVWNYYRSASNKLYSSCAVETAQGDLIFKEAWDSVGSKKAIAFTCLDSIGSFKWRKAYPNYLFSGFAEEMFLSPDGGLVSPVFEFLNGMNHVGAMKVDAQGNLVWKQLYHPLQNGATSTLNRLIQGPNDSYFLSYTFQKSSNDPKGINVLHLNQQGVLLDSIFVNPGFNFLHTRSQYLPLQGEILLVGWDLGLNGLFLRIDTNGVILNSQSYPGNYQFNDLQVRGSVAYLAGTKGSEGVTLATDLQGNRLWERSYPNYGVSRFWDLEILQNGDLLIAGSSEFPAGFVRGLLLRTDSLGSVFSTKIEGKVYWDSLANCNQDLGESSLTGRLILADPGPYLALTDSAGNYSMEVDTGAYTLRQVLDPLEPWGVQCPGGAGTYSVQADSFNLSYGGFDFANRALTSCPQLQVDISTPFIRRCFPGEYVVQYCNRGTAAADPAYVEVEIDPYLAVTGASIPFQGIAANVYRFPLGRVEVDDCGSFRIFYQVDCDSSVIGQGHCTEAVIYPDSLCLPGDSSWDGSSIRVEANCIANGDSVRFRIVNVSLSAMTSPSGYVVLEDNILRLQDSVQLGGLQDTLITFRSTGGTWGIFAEQVQGHPGSSRPSAAVEGCGQNPNGNISTGFITTWPHDDLDFSRSIECRPNISSYDPNDKLVFPEGFGPQHYIEDDQPLEYLIRFQNTGTDTAFRVIVKDVLPPYLEISSLKMLNASHPYRFRSAGPGQVEWIFDNILLPDSGANLLGSNGFLRFRIDQTPGNPQGQRIENEASIYFDFNPAIVTPPAFSTISLQPAWTMVSVSPPAKPSKVNLRAFPNPARGSFTLSWEEKWLPELKVELYDLNGRLLRKQISSGGRRIKVSTENLPEGMYLFRLWSEKNLTGSGKIMIYQ